MNRRNVIYLIIGLILIAGIFTTTAANKTAEEKPQASTDNQPTNSDVDNWKTYSNSEFEFRYPPMLTVSELDGVVNLNHQIPYKNNGGCDMTGDSKTYDNLTDFNISFKISPTKIQPSYIDGRFKSGVLDGEWAYQGAEGCGNTEYYFPLKNNGTLVVTAENIQALSSISSVWDKEEILQIPGVINKEKNAELLKQILSTFKFN